PPPQKPNLDTVLRVQHHAQAALIFDSVAAGTPIRAEGIGSAGGLLVVPQPPVWVRWRAGKLGEPVAPELRSVHLDTDAGTARFVWGHPLRYRPSPPPEWVEVTAPGGA